MQSHASKIEMVEMTDPIENAKALRQEEQSDRNSAWLQAHIKEAYADEHRGKCICIAGQELFVADSVEEATERARAGHPENDGWFTRYVPEVKQVRLGGVIFNGRLRSATDVLHCPEAAKRERQTTGCPSEDWRFCMEIRTHDRIRPYNC